MRKRRLCPVCGKYEFEFDGDVCAACGWEDDPVQEEDANYEGGANRMSLNQAKEAYAEGREIY